MSPPKSRHSEPRNTHIPSFSLVSPVLVMWPSASVAAMRAPDACSRAAASASAAVSPVSVNEGLLCLTARFASVVDLGRGLVVAVVAIVVVVTVVVRRLVVHGGLHHPAVERGDHQHP